MLCSAAHVILENQLTVSFLALIFYRPHTTVINPRNMKSTFTRRYFQTLNAQASRTTIFFKCSLVLQIKI